MTDDTKPESASERDEKLAEEFVGKLAPVIFNQLEEAKITYSEDLLCHSLSDGFIAGRQSMREEFGQEADINGVMLRKEIIAYDELKKDFLRLNTENENLRAGKLHTCHENCLRTECVKRRTIDRQEKTIEELRAALRFMFLTLGYYGTPYNYDDKNIVYHPISGKVASGIKFDGGEQAREANDKFRALVYEHCPELKPRTAKP